MSPDLLFDRALEIGVIKTFTEDIEQIVAPIKDAPGCADTEIVKLAAFVCAAAVVFLVSDGQR